MSEFDDKTKICKVTPSPHDTRDWQYEGLTMTSIKFPTKFMTKHLRPVKDQGIRGTCVAMALSCTKEYQETIDNPELYNELFSPNSVYFYREVPFGMYCRNAMKILKEKGMCREPLFPYSKTIEPKAIPPLAVKEASYYTIKSYAKVETIDGAKSALLNYGPLLIAFPYYNNGKAEFWKKPTIDAPINGGHAVAIVGWDETGFILRNSWGEKWNGNGHVIYPYGEWGSHWEIWSCIDLETTYLPDLGSPNIFKRLLCCK